MNRARRRLDQHGRVAEPRDLHPRRTRLAHPGHAQTRGMSLGPLQVMIVNFEDTNFTGEIEAELIRLEETGTLRVLDVIFVAKSD